MERISYSRSLRSHNSVMSNIAVARIKREFKEVIRSEEASISAILLYHFFVRVGVNMLLSVGLNPLCATETNPGTTFIIRL